MEKEATPTGWGSHASVGQNVGQNPTPRGYTLLHVAMRHFYIYQG